LEKAHDLVDRIVVNIRVDATGAAIAALVASVDLLFTGFFDLPDKAKVTGLLN
jgi:hypothetical protein